MHAQNPEVSIYHKDSLLTDEFVELLCESARKKIDAGISGQPSKLEKLINQAAGTFNLDSNQSQKNKSWWLQYREQCHCKKYKKFPEGNLILQILHADFRDFASIMGPHGKFPLSLHEPVPGLDITTREYAIAIRDQIQNRFGNERSRFQQNKQWKQWIFYFMLLTEYQVQHDVLTESDQ